MKRGICAWVVAWLLLAGVALAEENLTVFVSKKAMSPQTAMQLTGLMARELKLDEISLIEEEASGQSLRELVLMDQAPEIAICTPEEARIWAKEGLLVKLGGYIPDRARIQSQVLDVCSLDGEPFMAPLVAQHRMVAVNRRMLEKENLDELLNVRTHPVWYPLEMQQVLEAFALEDRYALEIWPLDPETNGGLLALIQAYYGGAFLSEDGQICQVESGSAVAGVDWLANMMESGVIGWARSREEALEHFLSGDTALFIDWTQEDAQLARTVRSELEVETVAYPSSTGMPVRSFEVTGAVVFSSGDAHRDAMAKHAVDFLGEDPQAQMILGERAIWTDGAVWLPDLGAHPQGALLRTVLCEALKAVLEGEMTGAAAMRSVSATLEAAR